MLVLSLLFIAIYIYVYIRAVRDDEYRPNDHRQRPGQHASNQTPDYEIPTPHTVPPLSRRPPGIAYLKPNNARYDNQPPGIICPSCGAAVVVIEQF
ncbi:unnamed protein product [Rotaria socialis]|nr:unnamed protein product [Rotaria socialis]